MEPFKLDNEPKIASGFKVPENYFDNFSTAMMEKLTVETIPKETKVVSIFRKRKKMLLSCAAVLTLLLTIPLAYKTITKNKDLDTVTIENYLAEEGHLNQYEIYGEIDPETIIVPNIKEVEIKTLEDVLVYNLNIENLVIEN